MGGEPGQPVPGHVDRAPLRLDPVSRPRLPRQLFPVTSTGLHCGTLPLNSMLRFCQSVPGHVDRAPLRLVGRRRLRVERPGCSRSRRPGSIAASTFPPGVPGVPAVPGHVDRAPLRRVFRDAATAWSWLLFPVTSTGLHCGPPFRRTTLVPVSCSRSRRPGSIAARNRHGPRGSDRRLFPVTSTGLHCGVSSFAGRGSLLPCSRSRRPGSIAARCLRRVPGRWPVCSRSRRPGSIAAVRHACARVWRC